MTPSSTPYFHTFLRVSTPLPPPLLVFLFHSGFSPISWFCFHQSRWWKMTFVSNRFICHIYFSELCIPSVSVQGRDRCTGMQQETHLSHL